MADEFDAEYGRLMEDAQQRAKERGRGDVADYLSLRATNDSARRGAVEWLLGAFSSAAGELNRVGAGITFTRTDAHRFRVGSSTMVGPRLVMRLGVRELVLEAGWPRTPRDGIVRGGGLASARISHFGDAASGEDLLLLPSGDEPRWFVLDKTGARSELAEGQVRRHLAKFVAHS